MIMPNKLISHPLVSVVLGSYNRRFYLKAAIESVRNEKMGFPYEIIVVDGGSTDGSLQYLIKQKDIITILQHNRGRWQGKPIHKKSWGYFMNLGFRAASGKYICMLSDDCLVIPGAINNGITLFEEKLSKTEKIGAVAFYWREWPGADCYKVGKTFGNKMFVNHGLFLRTALEEVNFIDEDNYNFYHADGDLILRMAEKGYFCIESPNSFIEHYRHANYFARKTNTNSFDWAHYQARWENLGIPSSSWIEKEYTDPNKITNKYWKTQLFLINFLAFLRHCKRILFSLFQVKS
jgi:glycosyltransferase involved in cell wall biosynthesis